MICRALSFTKLLYPNYEAKLWNNHIKEQLMKKLCILLALL